MSTASLAWTIGILLAGAAIAAPSVAAWFRARSPWRGLGTGLLRLSAAFRLFLLVGGLIEIAPVLREHGPDLSLAWPAVEVIFLVAIVATAIVRHRRVAAPGTGA